MSACSPRSTVPRQDEGGELRDVRGHRRAHRLPPPQAASMGALQRRLPGADRARRKNRRRLPIAPPPADTARPSRQRGRETCGRPASRRMSTRALELVPSALVHAITRTARGAPATRHLSRPSLDERDDALDEGLLVIAVELRPGAERPRILHAIDEEHAVDVILLVLEGARRQPRTMRSIGSSRSRPVSRISVVRSTTPLRLGTLGHPS